MRDSAGVRITTHVPDQPRDAPPAPEPILSIGREGDSRYEFFGVVKAAPLGNGNVVVANGGSGELRFYDPDGAYLRSVGRDGDGPVEFRYISELSVTAGDTLRVRDTRRQRIVYFDSAGTFLRGESYAQDLTTEAPRGVCAVPDLVGVLADHARVMRGWGCTEPTGSPGIRSARMTLTIARGERQDTVGRFQGWRTWERGGAPGPGSFEILPFGPAITWAVGTDRVFVSEGVDYEIRVHDARGGLLELWREERVPPPVTEEDRRLLRESREEEDFPISDDVPFAERFGAYDRLVVSWEGDVWARSAPPPSEGVTRWTVYAPDGSAVRHVVLPRMEVDAVRDGRIYGTAEGALGITSVIVLRAPGASAPAHPSPEPETP